MSFYIKIEGYPVGRYQWSSLSSEPDLYNSKKASSMQVAKHAHWPGLLHVLSTKHYRKPKPIRYESAARAPCTWSYTLYRCDLLGISRHQDPTVVQRWAEGESALFVRRKAFTSCFSSFLPSRSILGPEAQLTRSQTDLDHLRHHKIIVKYYSTWRSPSARERW